MAIAVRTVRKEVEVTVERGGETSVFRGIPLNPEEQDDLKEKYTSAPERIKGQILTHTDWKGLAHEKRNKVFTGWDVVDEEGKPVKFTVDNLYAVYLLNSSIIDEAMVKFDNIGRGITPVEIPKPKPLNEGAVKN